MLSKKDNKLIRYVSRDKNNLQEVQRLTLYIKSLPEYTNVCLHPEYLPGVYFVVECDGQVYTFRYVYTHKYIR